MQKVAAIVTCHNRAQTTKAGLESLLANATNEIDLRVFAVNDGSTDETAEVLSSFGSRVTPIEGDGSLFWAGGMRLAESEAMQWSPDYLLWFNDDVQIRSDSVSEAIDVSLRHSDETHVVVGTVISENDAEIIYGGQQRTGSHPLKFYLQKNANIGATETFNGNFVLINKNTHETVGLLSPSFRHAYADLDYGLRVTEKGGTNYILKNPVGVGQNNPKDGRMFDPKQSLRDRVRFTLSPFGLPPADHFAFCRAHVKGFWPLWFLRTYLRILIPKHQRTQSSNL